MTPARKINNGWLPSIFNDFFGNEWVPKTNASSPAINIIETENEFKVELAAPGATKDDFLVKIDDDGHLLVSMEKKVEKKEGEKDGRYLRREFSHTHFRQTMILPDNVEKDKISAKVEHGVLAISIPKKAEEAPQASGRLVDIE